MSTKLSPTALAQVRALTAVLAESTAALKAATARKSTTVTEAQRPAPPTAAALTTFGFTSAPGIGPSAAEVRAKAEAEALQARRDALPPTVTTWADRLSFAELEALAAVRRLFDANGQQPVAVLRVELAAKTATTPAQAETLLQRLVSAGAVEIEHRLCDASRYRPVAAPPAPKPARKAAAPAITAKPDPSALPRLRSALGVSAQ